MTSANGNRPHGPFSGLLVVDFSRALAGPFATMMLADMGARVIKVEQPGSGDDARGYGPFVGEKSIYFNFVNRGKESIALSLREDTDRPLLLNMLKAADVVVENFKPGTMEKLGLAYETLQKLNPRLIFASCSGFGQTGPMSRMPAYDTVIQALSGIMSITGTPEGPPSRVGTSIADATSGVYLFCGIVTALYAREQSGRGTRVDVAMLDGMLSLLLHAVMEYAASGKPLGRLGNRHPSITPFDTFQAQDTQFVICAGSDETFARLCAAIGRQELAGDPRFVKNRDRAANQAVLKAELEKTLTTHPVSHWQDIIEAAGVPVAKVQDIAEAVEMPQIAARNMIVTANGIRMPGNPLKIAGFDDSSTRAAAPALDQNGEQIRAEFGSGPAELSRGK